jgi:nicotinate-nucleotide adenylyltransferase
VRIGVLGGTFDPVHHAHLAIADQARQQLQLDRLLFVPVAIAPHKQQAGPQVAAVDRLAMIELALADTPAFTASAIEVARGGTSYTVDTLAELRGEYPEAELFLLIGADNYRIFPTWRKYERILELCTVAVYDRPGCCAGEITPPFIRLDGPRLDITSSWVRAQVAAGRSIRYFVPESVRGYIVAHGLYRLPQEQSGDNTSA